MIEMSSISLVVIIFSVAIVFAWLGYGLAMFSSDSRYRHLTDIANFQKEIEIEKLKFLNK